MRHPVRLDKPLDVIRPFAIVAAIAFAAGYWLYLASG